VAAIRTEKLTKRYGDSVALDGLDLTVVSGEVYRDLLIERFQLDTSKRIRALSKGNRQKVQLIAALATRAELLLLDEPTSGLDPKARALLKGALRARHARGTTIFFTSHSLADVEEMCDRMAVLHQGRIRYVGSPAGLRERHGEPTLERAFLACLEDSVPVAA